MKRLITFFSILFSSVLASYSQLQPNYIMQAEAVFQNLKAANGQDVWSIASEEMQQYISPQQFNIMMIQLEMQFGKMNEAESWTADYVDSFCVCKRSLRFEKATMQLTVTLKDSTMHGIFITPVQAKTRETIDGEQLLTLNTDGFKMPARLVLPKEAKGKKVPCVILVHGSGPGDMNETVGPNHLFYDLSVGLSQKGIAVFSYDKRTRVYSKPAPEGRLLDYDVETVDDALSAVLLMAQNEYIDSNNISIIGHSLGANLAPRIAQKSAKVKSIILMSGIPTTLSELIPKQMERMKAMGIDTVELNKMVEQITCSLPESYWNFDKQYIPYEAAKAISIPMLIMQGERDYQVTIEDFNLWKKKLKNRRHTRFISYPKLNHLYLEGESTSTPDEYNVKSSVPQYVVDDIADFIFGNGQ